MKRSLSFWGLAFLALNCGKIDEKQLFQKWTVEKIVFRDSSGNDSAASKNPQVVKQFEQEAYLDFTGKSTYKAKFFEIDFNGGLGADLNAVMLDHNGALTVEKRGNDTLQIKLRLPNAPNAASNNAESSLYIYELRKNRMVTGFSIGKRQGTEEFLEVTWKSN